MEMRMIRGFGTAGLLLGMCGGAMACGPFFPDAVLGKPQAALDVPPVSYLNELRALAGNKVKPAVGETSELTDQVPAEVEELGAVWKAAGVPEAAIKRRSAHYKEIRIKQLGCFGEPGLIGFPVKKESGLPARPLGGEFPKDVADYVEASRLLATGDKDGARALWKEIVERPSEEKRLRGAWAAWMLAKTAPDRAEAAQWYRRTVKEVEAGASDVLGLRAAALAWLATLETDPLEAIRLDYQAFLLGHERALIDLRQRCGRLAGTPDEELLTKAANDDLVRRLINIELFAFLDGPHYAPIAPEKNPWPPNGWFEALEARKAESDPDAARVAWALYSTGRFDRAERWLKLAPSDDARAEWLRGKFSLRAGKLDEAGRSLARAVKLSKSRDGWSPENSAFVPRWFDDEGLRSRAAQGRLLADFAVVFMATKNYARALDALVEGGYWEDAAYVAERVMTTKELTAYLKQTAPQWSKRLRGYWSGEEVNGRIYQGPLDPAKCFQSRSYGYDARFMFHRDAHDRLRYVLARRLAREWKFDAAREWMPAPWRPLFDYYVALHRARRSGKYSGETYAVIAWRQAWIHRHFGAELFGTESAPDGGARDWAFPMPDTGTTRARLARWKKDGDLTEIEPVPPPSPDEIRRVASVKPLADPQHRFHYRRTAARIAWKAAAALPTNHPMLAYIYNTAGLWIANRDPRAADKFYQAMVRRCSGTAAGRRADEKRWFLRDLRALGAWGRVPDELTPENARQKSRRNR